MAELLGVTPRTVHYYEEQGLVTPKRTDKGTRFYSDFDVRRLEVCVRLAELGVPIRTIARLAQIRPNAATGEESSHELVEVFSEIRSTFRKRLAGLRYMLGDLEKTERLVRTCWNCPNKPTRQDCPDCPCEVELNSAFIVNLTWDPDRPESEDLPGPLSGALSSEPAAAMPVATEPVATEPVASEPVVTEPAAEASPAGPGDEAASPDPADDDSAADGGLDAVEPDAGRRTRVDPQPAGRSPRRGARSGSRTRP